MGSGLPGTLNANTEVSGTKTETVPTYSAKTYDRTVVDPTKVGDLAPSDSFITDKSLSQNQLANIINKDSPLMQLARKSGMETANARGLLNSDIAANSAQTAMINAATPLAQQDASLYGQAGLKAQETASSLDILGQQAQNTLNQLETEYGFKSKLAEFENRLDSQLATLGYDRSDSQLMANLLGTSYKSMIDVAGTLLNNTDIEMSDEVLNWANQYSTALIDSVSSLFDYDMEF